MSNSKPHYLENELYQLIQRDPAIFEFIQKGSLDGLWYWDLESPEHEWLSPDFWQLLGIDPSQKHHLASEWQDVIFKEDLETALTNFNAHCQDPNHPYDQIVRYRHQSGSTVWVRCRGIAIRDKNGKPIRMLGAHNDFTELKKTEEKLTQRTLELETLYHEQEALNLKIRRQSAELIRSNKELGDFAYIASHDLKAPLRGIMSLTCWIEEDLQGSMSDQTKEYLDLMKQRVNRLDDLLTDLLAFSHVGKLHGDFKEISPQDMVNDIFQLLHPPEGFTIKFVGDAFFLTTLSVPLEQILRNLINNAIKHHDKTQAEIYVTASTTEDGFEFAVTDDGPSIEPDQHATVLELFKTLKTRDEVEGSGMGLAIIKKLLDSYGGQLTIESDGKRGTTMRFSWPNESTLRRMIHA